MEPILWHPDDGHEISRRSPHLTNAADAGLFAPVKTMVKKLLVVVLFAVAMLGGGELPILHAPQFAEAHAFVHQHMDGSIAAADQQVADQHDHGDADQQPGSDHGCTHVHAHCCAATAILVTVATAPPVNGIGQLRFDPNGAVPYGQLVHPPLRPPRLLA
jgi:hypothetical protein